MTDLDALASLGKVDDSTEEIVNLADSKKYQATKRKINLICKNLTMESYKYLPEKSVEYIENYVKTKDKMTRILYSEISNHLFNLTKEQRDIFLTNVEKMLIYALGKENSTSEDAAKIVVKIYDHTQLVNYQIESMNNVFAQRISDTKVDLHAEFKGVEKEYITILGIFAAIMLAFVGAFTFSTSVLNNVTDVNAYKLAVIALVIGFVFYNLVALLIDFLRDINGKLERDENGRKKTDRTKKIVNTVLASLIAASLIGYGFTKISFPEKVYIETRQTLPLSSAIVSETRWD